MKTRSWGAVLAAGALSLGAAACGNDDDKSSGSGSAGKKVSGTIAIDGSSTVYPFAQAAAEQFMAENPGVKITVGESGTGGGFEKFCAGETDISNASRPIKADEEVPICKKAGISFSETQVANDGIAVVTNKAITKDCFTVAELKKIWEPKSTDKTYSLYGPGTDSGTFEFFTEEIVGEKGASRTDYQPSEDDNVLVQGVAGDPKGLGYFGFSYYEANQDKLNLAGVDDGKGCKKPDAASIQDGSYTPLARPLFMYPKASSLAKPHVKAFMDYVLANYDTIAENAQIVPMTGEQATKAQAGLKTAESGA
jgi:phosphate transport system substrate-binding protein